MKMLWIVGTFVLLVSGCSSAPYNDEKMYDLASQFKDLAQTVDGEVKFGEKVIKNGDEALTLMKNEAPEMLLPFAAYTIKIDIQGDNAVLLLCDEEIALIEDAGCNALLDKTYWQEGENQKCEFRLDSAQLCE